MDTHLSARSRTCLQRLDYIGIQLKLQQDKTNRSSVKSMYQKPVAAPSMSSIILGKTFLKCLIYFSLRLVHPQSSKLCNSIYKFIFVVRLDISPDVFFELMPEILNWISIWRLCRCLPPMDTVILKEGTC